MEARKMTEVKPPDQLKFERPGDEVRGYLLSFQTIEVHGKPAREFTIQPEGTKDRATFLGTWDLEKRLGVVVRHFGWGIFVSIEYTGEDESIQTGEGRNKLKRFKVQVDEKDRYAPKPAAGIQANLEVTDDDIPF